jgi:peptidoglycan/xylan/chitin deacetylase (PgdA/CDA1 family)
MVSQVGGGADMNAAVTSRIKRALLAAGYYRIRLRANRFPGVAVLCYHGVRDDHWPSGTMVFENLHVRARELEAHCRLLRQTCHPISLREWRAARAGDAALPARPVLLTFDDGYRTVFTLARPILQRYDIPAVAFVCSEPVEQRQWFWHDAVGREHGEAAAARAKTLPFAAWQRLREQCAKRAADDDPHAPLTIGDVHALARDGCVEVAGHTAAHAILARASRSEQHAQITDNKLRLEAWTGTPVHAFAYPNGQPREDYTSETVELVRESGVDTAFTTRHGFALPDEPTLERSRFFMLAGVSAAELAHRLTRSWRR